ncbi:caspase family protein [Bradyrhizobium sp. LHD-71]|uniref:caspase family protein n=1 Tax=Bradyrhizobium sp. LHD-71 TaxID=3072141 RepID=UPI00280EB368|nr:caspase family protein [Bradyrhizobium sp. LHD-71]MDQ8726693.1 caspase family protein [Bradyrhizobium sp. LHD-71]
MLRHFKAAAVASLFAIIACNPAFAENRLALVIGNSAYRTVSPLPNAESDAKRMGELLGSAGFEVMNTPDLSQDDLRKTIAEFAGKLAASGPDTVALVFYAGHGIQVDGENFLVPVDIDPKREADIPLQAVRLNDLLNTLNSVPNKMRIVMLDACRNNPFPTISQTTGRGLAMVDTRSGAPGTFISYSTSPGAEAEDGTGANSPYTTALLNVARERGLPIEEAFKRVRVAVNDATQGRQVPWESSSLTSDFRFFAGDHPTQPDGQAASGTTPAKASSARSTDDWRRELQGKDPEVAYRLVIAEDSIEGYEAFVVVFPQSPHAVRTRHLADRRKEMIAWNTAVIVNAAASYRSFVVSYPGSDLAPTARKLEDRVRNRSLTANAAVVPAAGAATPAATPTPVSLPSKAAGAPATCPCTVAPPPAKRKVDTRPPMKKAETPPPRRVRPPIDDDIVIYTSPPPPPRVYIPPRVIGDGISIGGVFGRPSGRYPSGGYRPPRYSPNDR